MALRIWSQISGVHKCINKPANVLDLSVHASGRRFLTNSITSESVGGVEEMQKPIDMHVGRFVRRAPGPGDPEMLNLRPLVRRRIQHGMKKVTESAKRQMNMKEGVKYTLRDGSEFKADHEKLQRFKRYYVRQQSVAALQPYHQVTYCSKHPKTFFREDVSRYRSFVIGKPPKRGMATKSESASLDSDSVSALSLERVSVVSENEDGVSIQIAPDVVADRADKSETMSVASKDSVMSQKSFHSEEISIDVPTSKNNQPNPRLSNLVSNTIQTQKSYVGNNYTQYVNNRYFSLFAPSAMDQRRTMSAKKPPTPPKDCKDKEEIDPNPPRYIHNMDEPWKKCECCPEMLDCDHIIDDIEEALFPCPTDLPYGQEPPDCPEPPEPIPPKKVPLPRLGNRKVYHCTPECTNGCKTNVNCQLVLPKTLPAMKKGNCKCREDPPLQCVHMVRLPKICMCPSPPDPNCRTDDCPPRADIICKWEFPVRKLKDFWCPYKPVTPPKYKICQCHTRTQRICRKGEKVPPTNDGLSIRSED